jgi:predicted secreted hydrolase
VTDLATGERFSAERSDVPWGPTVCQGPPLCVGVGGWTLVERPDGGFAVRAGELALDLDPGKPRTVHPPGWSEGRGTGRLLYQSATRLPFRGTWRGAPIRGEAWLDHQWGDLVPGGTGRWSWYGLHLDSGDDVMVYDTTRPDGSGRVLAGTLTDARGTTRPLEEVTLTATSRVGGTSGRRYDVAHEIRARDLELSVTPLGHRQEFVSPLARWAYWEGPVRVRGVLHGRPVAGVGMGEHFPVPR